MEEYWFLYLTVGTCLSVHLSPYNQSNYTFSFTCPHLFFGFTILLITSDLSSRASIHMF
jgi:hypothetical protein